MIRCLLFLIVFSHFNILNAQSSIDTLKVIDKSHQFTYKKLIAPSALISIGTITAFSKSHNLDLKIKNYSQSHFSTQTQIDDYLQFLPGLAVYGLNMVGVKGQHDFWERSIIYAGAGLITGAIVLPLKEMGFRQRPNQSNFHSFPSGHTAVAFVSAHFMFREYRDKDIWLALSAYPVAFAVGAMRISNNKHWFSDVAAGAGIGILSTELAYWAYPFLQKRLNFGKHHNRFQCLVLPSIGIKNIGLNCQIGF